MTVLGAVARRVACDLLASVTHPGWTRRRAGHRRAWTSEQLRGIRLAAFDLDGTLTDCRNSWHRVTACYPGRAGAERAAYLRYRRGDLDYAGFCQAVAALWDPPPDRRLFERLCRATALAPGAAALVELLRDRGVELAIVSTGLHPFADHVGGLLGIDRRFANRLAFDEGGRLQPPVEVAVTPGGKAAVLQRLGRDLGIAREQVLYVGDTRDDRAAVEWAGLGVFLDNANPAKGSADLIVRSLGELHACWRR